MPVSSPTPIVVALTSFDIGGTEHQMVELVRRLDARQFRVHVACFHRRGSLLSKMPPEITIREFPVHGFGRPAAVGQLVRFAGWCRSVEARVVHACDLYANIFALTGGALARVPVRIGSRREVLTGDKTPTQLRAQRLAYRAAQTVVANSKAAVEQLQREGVERTRIALIPNGIDLAAFAPPPARVIVRKIAMVANLRPEKGHDLLIDAAPAILAREPEAEFFIAGDGPLRQALETRATGRGVASRFHFLGQCNDVPALLATSDLFVLPSRSEAFPNAVIEAMAAGLPVVASEVGGIPELVKSGVTGMLVPPGDAAALARSVLDLMDRPGFAAALGEAARARIEQEFSFDRMVGGFERVYAAGLEKHARTATKTREWAAS